jgi:uncharacterized repeat protein (TIGR01451 family)
MPAPESSAKDVAGSAPMRGCSRFRRRAGHVRRCAGAFFGARRTLVASFAACLLAALPVFAQSDLTITKSHVGSLTQGQVGAQYTITVTNSGGGPVSGLVTVVDAVPAGITATDMSGAGWGCDLPTATCTTLNPLNPGQSYPDITLTVTVALNAGIVVNSVSVSGGGDVDTSNNTATDRADIIPLPPALLKIASRKVHGAAGTFDLPLSMDLNNPTTEPRLGPAFSIVLTFDKPIVLFAGPSFTEGVATFSGWTRDGNDVIFNIAGVADQQYLTTLMLGITAGDHGFLDGLLFRIGLLAGDVNQNRVVTLADLGLVNQQLAQPVTAANYLKDVNVSGTLSLADKGITNTRLTKALPAP